MNRKEVRKMARPITPTPKLDRDASEIFLKQVNKDLRSPVGPVSTPRLDDAIKKIMADAHQCAK
jgi:hypothetical protein